RPSCVYRRSIRIVRPLSLARQPGAGRRHITHGATLASRPRLRLARTLPLAPLPTADGLAAAQQRAAVPGNEQPFSGAVAASGAVTQTPSGERPAGLRTTRAELFKAKTAPALRQGLV